VPPYWTEKLLCWYRLVVISHKLKSVAAKSAATAINFNLTVLGVCAFCLSLCVSMFAAKAVASLNLHMFVCLFVFVFVFQAKLDRS
jgi:hypothetical protein